MTKEDFQFKKLALELEFKSKIKELLTGYALSNNSYTIGDIIEDHIGKGKILEISVKQKFNSDYSECIYLCDNLTKNGSISKREPKRWIYQSNLKDKK